MEAIVKHLVETALAWGPNLIGAVVILLLGWWGARLLRGLLARSMSRASVDQTLVRFVGSLFYTAVMVLVVIAALGRLGVNTTSFAAIVAAAGLAVGLAFQDSLSNFAAGVLLIVFRPFKAGDYVEAGGVAGSIEEVEVFTTVLKTPDNRRVIVPNSQITGGSITNYSANDTRRVDLVFGIAYDDDMRKAKQVLETVMARDERILRDPAPVVAVAELADSSVNLVCRPWVRSADYWGVRTDLLEAVKRAFDAEGLSFPFPQTDVHLHQEDASAA